VRQIYSRMRARRKFIRGQRALFCHNYQRKVARFAGKKRSVVISARVSPLLFACAKYFLNSGTKKSQGAVMSRSAGDSISPGSFN